MSAPCLLYYITDRTAFSGDENSRHRHLLAKISEATRANVDYIQLREKDLPSRDLESLAQEAVSVIARLRTENREPANGSPDQLPNGRGPRRPSRRRPSPLRRHLAARSERSMEMCVSPMWRGRPRPRNLARRSADRSLLSLFARCSRSRCQPSILRRLRTGLRKERRKSCGPRSAPRSMPGKNSCLSARRDHTLQRPLLPRSRSRRHSRHPPLPGKQHLRSSARLTSKVLRVPHFSRVLLREKWGS